MESGVNASVVLLWSVLIVVERRADVYTDAVPPMIAIGATDKMLMLFNGDVSLLDNVIATQYTHHDAAPYSLARDGPANASRILVSCLCLSFFHGSIAFGDIADDDIVGLPLPTR